MGVRKDKKEGEHDLRAKELIVYHFHPGKKVFLASVELKDVPGALASVATLLSKAGVNVLSGFTAFRAKGPTLWGFFAEGAREDLSASRLKKVIEKSQSVRWSEVREGNEGLVVDSIHFPLKLNTGERVIVGRIEVFVNMFKRLREMYGSAGETILFEQGVASGESDGRALVETFGQELARESILELSMLYSSLGWGRPELLDFSANPFSASIRIYESFECGMQKSQRPVSQFLRGHLCGLASVLFEKRVKCEEARCSAQGNGYCEFTLFEAKQG